MTISWAECHLSWREPLVIGPRSAREDNYPWSRAGYTGPDLAMKAAETPSSFSTGCTLEKIILYQSVMVCGVRRVSLSVCIQKRRTGHRRVQFKVQRKQPTTSLTHIMESSTKYQGPSSFQGQMIHSLLCILQA